jgi:hypothetical protein
MALTAGQMILAGDVPRVLWAWERAGRGSAGWVAAERMLRDRHPGVAANSVRAVLRIAQETARIGDRYRRGGPGYTPPDGAIPDARPLEYGTTGRPAPGPTGRRPPTFFHETIIEIYDPDSPDEIAQRFGYTIQGSELLTRDEIERLAREQADQLLNRFINYERERLQGYGFQARVKIEGAYKGL